MEIFHEEVLADRVPFYWPEMTTGTGGVSLLIFIVFAIKVYHDGKWA